MIYDEFIHSWILDKSIRDKHVIRYKDRTEYKKNDIYHNLNGPAIKYNNNSNNKYYIEGKLLTEDEWNFQLRGKKLKKLLNNI